jgi:predicted GH43/DUF377 family glycosyl hydrolase
MKRGVQRMPEMERFSGNPILNPIPRHSWESRRVFNAAALYAGGRVHIFYRALGDDEISRLGYASSPDGYQIDYRSAKPVFEPLIPAEHLGCEDPRVTLLDGKCLMTYTAVRSIDGNVNAFQAALTTISLNDLLSGQWNWGPRILPFSGIRNKDAAVFPARVNRRYVMYHRIDPDICVAYSRDLKHWYDFRAVASPRPESWDCQRVGIAGPPIDVGDAWLVIYHGSDYGNVYRLGLMLVDRDDPEQITYRSEKPILEPVEPYERFGKVPNVVFSCGSVVVNDRLLVYYGGADSVLCLATFDLQKIKKGNL